MCSGLRAAHEIFKWKGIGSLLDMKLQIINEDKLRFKLLHNFPKLGVGDAGGEETIVCTSKCVQWLPAINMKIVLL